MLLFALSILWLLPFFWVGSMLGRLPFRVPDRLWQQYSAAGLFTKRTPTWSDWRVEVRIGGSPEWRKVSMAEVSPMPTSGYRQRMDRILGDTRSRKIAGSLRLRLAGWIAQRLKQQTGQEISGVRYLYRRWQANTPELASPAGHWDGDLALPATTRVSVLDTYAITDGTAKLERAKPSVPAAVPQPRVFRRAPAPGSPGNI